MKPRFFPGWHLGIYGDFLFSEATQHSGQSAFGTLVGPVGGLVEDALKLTLGNMVEAAQGKKTNAGAELVRFTRSNTPFMNTWYAKAALDHLLWNQAAEYLSPGYLSAIRSRAQRDYGQTHYWPPEDVMPERGPDLSQIVK